MKVKEILKELENVDPETEVKFALLEGCCGDVEFLEGELDVYKLPQYAGGHWDVQLTFEQLRGYESCRKAGAMNELAEKLSSEEKDNGDV